jgi:hypothetical protein
MEELLRGPAVSRTRPHRATAATPPSRAQGDRRGPAPRRGPLTLPIAALIVVLAGAAAGAGSWYAARTIPAARLSSLATSPDPGHSASTASPSAVPIAIAPPAALYPEAALIQPAIAAYFRAINRRDYAEYLTTQSPGEAMTAEQFQTGFRSTQDSSVLVTSIAIAPDGRRTADLTFTSRQRPQDGPGGESCTNWHLTLFFDVHAGTYTIGTPPADYHASYQSCS